MSLRNRVIKEIRAAKSNFFVDLIRDAKGNHKQIWDCLHKLTGKGYNKATKQLEIKDNGTLYKEPAEIVTIFNSHFVNSVRLTVHSPISGPLHSSPIDVSQPVFSLTEISETKVQSIITSIKNSKSKDIFGLDSMFLKKHEASFTGPVTKIINTSFKEGKFPNDWKSAIVVPVYKSGDTTDMNNYRPISILPIMSKISEKYVAEQLTEHLNSSPFKLHPMQFGFRANHSAETANCFFVENIKTKLDKGGIVGAIFLDLKKAFDTVNHEILIHKMSYFNFSTSFTDWMRSYLSNRVQCVRVSGETSPPLRNELGVPQGSVLFCSAST